jgi:mRNA interferase MazF
MKKGEIYMAQFEPSVGHEYKGFRPALVVQAVELDKSPVVTIVPMTSRVEKSYMSDIEVRKSPENGLAVNSVALIRFVMSFDRSRFTDPDFKEAHGGTPRRVGIVDRETMEKVDTSLRVHLGLGSV